MADETIELIKIDIDIDGAVDDILKYQKKVNDLKGELKEYKTEEQQLTAEYVKKRAELKNNETELRSLQNMTAKLTGANELQGISIQKLQAENSKLEAEKRKLNLLDAEQLKRSEEISAVINRNTELIAENSSKQAQNKMNVGNYTDSIKAATEGMNGFNGSMTNNLSVLIEMSQQSGGLASVFATIKTGLVSATKAAWAFIATPIGAILAAVVAAIGLFTSILSKNKDITDKLGQVWEGITAVFDVVIGRITSIVNGMIKLVSGDFLKGIEEIGGAFGGMADEMSNAYEAGIQLAKLQKEIERGRIAQITTNAELEAKERALQLAADDNTKSLKQRQAATDALMSVQRQKAKTELEFLKQEELAKKMILDREVGKNKKATNETLKEYNEAKAKRIAGESEITQIESEGSKKRREIQMEETERRLDFLIDGYDATKTVNEKIIANEKNGFEERKRILDQTRAKGDDVFKLQIETINKFSKTKIDGNKLMQISDAETLYNQVKAAGVNDILAGRLLEIYRERKMAQSDLAESEQALNLSVATAAVKQMEFELNYWKATNKTKLTDKVLWTEENVQLEKDRLQKEAEQANLFLESQLLNEQITQEDYALKFEENKQAFDETRLQLDQDFRDRKIAAAQTDYETQFGLLENNLIAQLELERANLDVREQQEIESASKTGANVLLIEKKYSKAKNELTKVEWQSKLAITKSFADNLATIAGQGTSVGKAAAVASTTISTIEGAQAAFTSTTRVFGPIAGGIAAAAAVAVGLANVKKILAVKSGLPGESSGASVSLPSSTAQAPPTVQDVNPIIGQGIVSRNSINQSDTSMKLQPTLVIDEVTRAQNTQLSINKTQNI